MYNLDLEEKINLYIKNYADAVHEQKFVTDFNKLMLALSISPIGIYVEVFQREFKKNMTEEEFRQLANYIAARNYVTVITDNRLISMLAEDDIDFLELRKRHLDQFLDLMKFEDIDEIKFFNFVNGMGQNNQDDILKALKEFSEDILESMGCMITERNTNLAINSYIRTSDEIMETFMDQFYPNIVNGNIRL